MSKIKLPSEKKRLSLERDCRNVFGESPHAARKNIPKRKAMQHQQERHHANQLISRISGVLATEQTELAESASFSDGLLKRLKGFRKWPDHPLGKVIQQKLEKRKKLYGRRTKD